MSMQFLHIRHTAHHYIRNIVAAGFRLQSEAWHSQLYILSDMMTTLIPEMLRYVALLV